MNPSKKETDHQYYLKNKERLIRSATGWNRKNRESHRKHDKKWRAKNPTKSRAAYLKRTYQLTIEEYELIKTIQEGRCAICLLKKPRLVIDHCHNSDKIRGLLCTTCNAGIGQFNDNVGLLFEAIKYLERHATT